MAKRKFSSPLASNEITTRGYRALTFAKCTTVMTAMLSVTSSLGSRIVGFGCGMVWFGFGLAIVELYDL
jgi:hypothetical protein